MTDISTTAQFICNICDCVSIGKKGDPTVQQVFDKFGYANTYKDRMATKKSLPGTFNISGDGSKNRYIINMYVQFYPGSPKYPSDNIVKRMEWFTKCLDKLLDVDSIVNSLAFPRSIGVYELINYHDRYLTTINDFRKKYYLKKNVDIRVVDYSDKPFNFESEIEQTKYAEPINILKMCDDQINITPPPKTINIIQHIENIKKLIYVPNKPNISEKIETPTKCDAPTENEIPVKSDATTKMVIGIKKSIKMIIPPEKKHLDDIHIVEKIEVDVAPEKKEEIQTENNEQKMRVYDKNPTWTRKISELAKDVDPSWDIIFKDPKIMKLLMQLDIDFEKEMNEFGDFIEILPIPQDNIFNAFNKCPFDIVKTLIIGQDVYPSNLNEAMGLSFSVQDGVKHPPTLENIFRELSTDINDFKIPQSGNLTKWAERGVLLLNSALTVRYKQKETHMKIWKPLTDAIIQLISEKSRTPIVFMLWGNFAKGKKDFIKNQSKHLILEAVHPSPLSASRSGWFGCKHFSKCNDFLIQNKITPIDWNLS